MDIDYDYDFGFTAVNESELTAVQEASKTQEEADQLKDELAKEKEKSQQLYKMILPLLENLKKNPEKDYIFWPKRTSIIDNFKTKLDSVISS